MEQHHLHDRLPLAFDFAKFGVLGRKRAEHHRIFQAFRAMNSDNLHGVLVAFEPELKFIRRHRVAGTAFFEPLHKLGGTEMFGAAGGFQQFSKVQ